ncbi:hypothetical protein BRADI_1g60392v3 [Brachypodium distachyon]|uniref:Uncharacterized protein n=1 Tax=Brachypodium distachyon TaxID=15368 RepID=A0A0Q3HES2_BRADI|nr:hypothetical protein BRADI_1g60392v3 [Brachypodium distachyon]
MTTASPSPLLQRCSRRTSRRCSTSPIPKTRPPPPPPPPSCPPPSLPREVSVYEKLHRWYHHPDLTDEGGVRRLKMHESWFDDTGCYIWCLAF